jgi:hypothetical protein
MSHNKFIETFFTLILKNVFMDVPRIPVSHSVKLFDYNTLKIGVCVTLYFHLTWAKALLTRKQLDFNTLRHLQVMDALHVKQVASAMDVMSNEARKSRRNGLPWT